MPGKLLRFGLIALAVALVVLIAAAFYAGYQLRASLPVVEGTRVVRGLGGPVTVARDALGVPTVTGASREDVARALGFLHAQDRFFQMDLQRRQPAGELAALVGPRAVEADQQARLHRLRDVAHRALDLTDPSYRRLLDAYADGVNAGLAALGAPPFEYLVLRATPEPWRAEDTILTVLAMFNTLQGRQAAFEQTLGALRDTLPDPMFRFLAAPGSEWETPVLGNPLVRPPIPGPEVYDLRNKSATETQRHGGDLGLAQEDARLSGAIPNCLLCASVPLWRIRAGDEAAIIGSNNWAVDGAHTASGGALVANDMHLAIGVPVLWYRASLAFPDPAEPSETLRVTGLSLPGLPAMVVGSNGHVAWGFTNTGGDWSDLVRIEPDARDPSKYLTPDGPAPFDVFTESIAVKGEASRPVAVHWTMWGPIVWKDAKGREYAQRWLAHDPAVMSSDISKPERARTVDDLLAAVAGLGMPNQNVAMADESGRIAWTVGGVIPRRIGHDGSTPESWADGTARWDGYLPADEFPRIVDPEDGRLWTANAPVVDGAMLATIGEGGFADGIRARLIRDRLMQMAKATPRDMLDVQLENRALFLERWRTLVLETLARARGHSGPGEVEDRRRNFSALVETTWTGRASADSTAYLLVKAFRATFVREVMTSLTAPALAIDPTFDYTRSFRGEGPVWQLLTERPLHLLDPKYATWDDRILAAVDATIAEVTADGRAVSAHTWGEANRSEMRHPLASAIPLLGRWLNMPSEPLPGDVFVPRAHAPRTGPSERMVVSPGREAEGILNIPTGQSGHPLSPHYGDQYRAWLDGEPTPFLPGPAVSTLTLVPR
jgi:penicillin G amidase